jgi:hypothetical protein
MTIWNMLMSFGIFNSHLVYLVCGHFVHFSRLGMFEPRKIWQPWVRPQVPVHGSAASACFCYGENSTLRVTRTLQSKPIKTLFLLQFLISFFLPSSSGAMCF